MGDDGQVRLDVIGRTAVVTLDRPAKANAISSAMTAQLGELAAEVDRDPGVAAVVVTGAGSRSFSAGSDVRSLDEYETAYDFRHRVDYCDHVRGIRKPVIAAVNGTAVGGGLEIALNSDLRIASTTARFAAPEIKLGWVGGGGSSQLLPRLVGYGQAFRILYTGELVDADEAYRIGLVEQLCAPEQLLPTALELAERIGANAPLALQTTKRAVRAAMEVGLEAGMVWEEELVNVCMTSADSLEGRRAFAEKRPAAWRGR